MSGVYVERGRPEDAVELAALDELASERPWSRGAMAGALAGPARGVLVARALETDGARIVGFCSYQVAADELEIHGVAVHPGRRRQGLGGLLLELALREGRRRGAGAAFLEVRQGNQAAEALYARHGFEPAGRRPGYYSGASGPADAWILSRRL